MQLRETKCPNCLVWNKSSIQNTRNSFFMCEICGAIINALEKTLLSKSKIQLTDLNIIFDGFLERIHYKKLKTDCHFNTVNHYYDIFNRIVMDHYISQLDLIILDGSVEIDETRLFKEHNTKANHRLYQSHDVWLFGLIERSTKRFILFPISNREENTLTKVIIKFVKKGSIIYSDCYSSYVNIRSTPKRSKISQFGYIHFFINHSNRFVSKTNPHIHTNTIENLWGLLKKEIYNEGIKV